MAQDSWDDHDTFFKCRNNKRTEVQYAICVCCNQETDKRFLDEDNLCPSCLEGLAEGE